MHACVSYVPRDQRKGQDSLKLELWTVGATRGVLGIDLRSSTKAASALNNRVIFFCPNFTFNF